MIKKVTYTSIIVRNQDEALKFYTDVMGLEVRSDQSMEDGMRWLTVAPKEQTEMEIVLQPTNWGPEAEEDAGRADMVGKQPGFVLTTDDIRSEVARMKDAGVEFHGEIMEFPWGVQAVFADLYGNMHVLSELPTE